MKIYLSMEAPYEWARVNGKKVEAFGEVASLSEYPLNDDDEIIGVVPGEWVTTHRVNLPARSRKQFNSALPYALEESISEEVDQTHFVCHNWKAGESSNVLVVSKSKMREWQSAANDNRLAVAQLVPDYTLLPFHDGADCSLALSEGVVHGQQKNGVGVSIDQDFLDVWMMDVPVASTIAVNDLALTESLIKDYPERDFRHWSFGSKMAHWLEYAQEVSIDLWSGGFRPKVRRVGLRTFIMPLALVFLALFFKLGYDTFRYFSLHKEIESISQESQTLFQSTFPELGNVAVGQERNIMTQAILRMSGSNGSKSMPAMLAEVANVLSRQKVTMVNLVYRNEKMLITCLLSDFSQVDKLSKQLNAKPNLTAQLQSSATEGESILASYEISQN